MTDPSPPPKPDEPVIIERPNVLKEKVGGSLDAALASKAEQSVQLMAGDFRQWLEDVVQAMAEARTRLETVPLTRSCTGEFYAKALEVKSLGETYGYALITRFANSLCKLLIKLEGERPAPPALVDAHIDAIRAALRSNMKSADHPVGQTLATELEQQVAAFHQIT